MGNAESQSRFGKDSTAEEVVKGLDLRGKVAVITGITSHVATETAKALVKQGATVVGGCSNMAAGGRLEEYFEQRFAAEEVPCEDERARGRERGRSRGGQHVRDKETETMEGKGREERDSPNASPVLGVSGSTADHRLRSKAEFDRENDREKARGRAGTGGGVDLKERSKRGRFVCLLLDLSSYESIQAFFANFLELGLPLHVLINAETVAGIESFERAECGVERHFAVNYLGHFLLSMLLLPSLLASKPSRIISVSSSAHSELFGRLNCFDISRLPPVAEDYHEWGTFALSKLCLILFSAELDRKFGRQGLLACSLHPGLLTAENIKNKSEKRSKSAAQAAATVAFCATQAGVRGGGFYADCAPAQASSEATNKHFALLLWRLSERLLKSAGVQWQPVDNKIEIMIEDARMHAAILNSASIAISQEHWQPDSDADTCLLCEVEFTTRVRKHHCRFCGSIVCQACSRLTMEPISPPGSALLRACNSCVVARLWNEAI